MSIDMSSAAIAARLREASRRADLRTEKRLHGKVDMSPGAIARRLREVEQLRRLCLKLAALRPSTSK